MKRLRNFIARLLCKHDHRLQVHTRNHFDIERWQTVEVWRCKSCGKDRFFDHL